MNTIKIFATLCTIVASVTLIHTSENSTYPFSAIDRHIFHREASKLYTGYYMDCPYSTASINIMSQEQEIVAIEKKTFYVLHKHAFTRSKSQKNLQQAFISGAGENVFEMHTLQEFQGLKDWCVLLCDALMHTHQIHERITKIGTESLNNNVGDMLELPEGDLMVLLQWLHCIQRTGDVVKIGFDTDRKKMIEATPLLLGIINKHRAHEKA